MNNLQNYILFKNHTDGMKLSNCLTEMGIKHTMCPTPRQLSVCCGVSIMYDKENHEKIKHLIQTRNLEILSFECIEVKFKSFYD